MALMLVLLLGQAAARACSVSRRRVDGWRAMLLTRVPDAVERLFLGLEVGARGSADAVLAAAAAGRRGRAERLLGHQHACPFRSSSRGVSMVVVSPASKLKTTN